MYKTTPGFASEHSHLRGFSLQLQESLQKAFEDADCDYKAAEEEIYTGWEEEIP